MEDNTDIEEHLGVVKEAKEVFTPGAEKVKLHIPQMPLPEAPASVTYTIETGTGFNCLFTVREFTGIALLNKMPGIEKKFAELGIKPQVKRSFGAPKPAPKVVSGKQCPKCSNDLVEATTKAGALFHKCSTQKYDFTTKQTTGCDYVNWDPETRKNMATMVTGAPEHEQN